jgi:tetraacyldisaccharide 4'-kinase
VKRFWELVVNARGADRFYCFPFLLLFRLITPAYQTLSQWNLRRRKGRCSGGWKAKVISVGNITVGGSGKTPIVIELAGRFIARSKSVVIVHSGYGRKSKADCLIGYGRGGDCSVDQTGDEVAMMARFVPQAGFAVGRDKKKMVALADQDLSPDVIIIDDGYQRLDIKKDVDIAVASSGLLDLFFNNHSGEGKKRRRRRLRLFPGGILRERPGTLERADAVFVVNTGSDKAYERLSSKVERYDNKALIIGWHLFFEGAERDGVPVDLNCIKERNPFLFAGIGSFERLLTMIKDAGIKLSGYYRFGDHYEYDKLDIEHLRNLACDAGADCYLTTAKDLVKLAHQSFDLPLYCLNLAARPDDTPLVDGIIGLESA